MSAEGLGLTIGFATLFLAIVGLFISQTAQARVSGKDSGIIQEKVANAVKTLSQMEYDNKAGHTQLFECQKETDVKVAKIEQHLLSMNGSMKRHSDDIESLKKDSHKEGG